MAKASFEDPGTFHDNMSQIFQCLYRLQRAPLTCKGSMVDSGTADTFHEDHGTEIHHVPETVGAWDGWHWPRRWGALRSARELRLGLALVLGLAALSGCDRSPSKVILDRMLAPGPSTTHAPFKVTTSGLVYAARMSFQPMHWLDNDHVVLPARAVLKSKDASGKEVLNATPVGIYVWDVKTNQYTRHADLEEPSWFFCFNSDTGFIGYSVAGNSATNQRTIFAGPFGQERLLPTPPKGQREPELEQCEEIQLWFDKSQPGYVTKKFSLHKDDGYIFVATGTDPNHELNAQNQDDPVRLIQPSQSQPVKLPILAKEMDFRAKLTYSKFAEEYVLLPNTWRQHDVNDGHWTWPTGMPYPVYLISRKGHVEATEIPSGPWFPTGIFVTKRGLVWVSNEMAGSTLSAGGRLIQENRVIKLYDHYSSSAGISPDGCKLAYANNDMHPETVEYVSVIDLCTPETKE